MNRTDLQNLSTLRLREARVLLAAGETSGAYYLAGYAVECALKAVIAKETQQHEFPDRDRVRDSYTHDLEKLLKVAKLNSALDAQTNDQLTLNWKVIQDWDENSRYKTWDKGEAQDILNAVDHQQNGVLPWLTQFW